MLSDTPTPSIEVIKIPPPAEKPPFSCGPGKILSHHIGGITCKPIVRYVVYPEKPKCTGGKVSTPLGCIFP